MGRPKTTSDRKERKHSEKKLPGMCTGVGKPPAQKVSEMGTNRQVVEFVDAR